MSQVILKRGTKQDLENEPLKDGLLSFTVDDGRIHMDYTDGNKQLRRVTFYSGKLTFGNHVYDGTSDVDVEVYKGTIEEE